MTDLLRWGDPGLPDQKALWRRASDGLGLLLQHSGPIALAAAGLSLVLSAMLAVGYFRYERLATAEATAASHAAHANAELQDALSRLRDQLGAANQTLTTTQTRIATLSNQTQRQLADSRQAADAKTDRVAALTKALEQVQRELRLAEAQRATLVARLSKSEVDLAQGRARQQQKQAGVDQWQKQIQQLTADRDRAAAERDQLRAKIAELQQKLSMRQRAAAQAVAAAAPPAATANTAAPAQRQVAVVVPGRAEPIVSAPSHQNAATPAAPAVVPAVSRGGLAEVERVLASTGVDMKHLFADFGVGSGLGGPYVPARDAAGANQLSADKLAVLASLVKTLPVSAPMSGYRETSPFGERRDPFNGRAAFHPGIDLAAPYNTPVYATAPGVVTYAGYRSDYGKIVEIDHGHGIVTRYGHLSRYSVLVGQRVATGAEIGLEGSTGRSTGPHVIYEIDVNGEPQDPAKFFRLAHLMQLAEH